MKRITGLLIGAALLLALPLAAQDSVNTASMNGLTVSYPDSLAAHLIGSQFAGEAPVLEAPGGPQPPYTELMLFPQYPAPESFLDSAGAVRAYRVADAADYPGTLAEMNALAALLADRPDLGAFMAVQTDETGPLDLPFLPVFPAGQALRARAEYVDLSGLSGITYLTVFRHDVSPFIGYEFLYTFQGLTADGGTYISAVFPLFAPGFPDLPADFDYAAFAAGYEDYVAESIASLNAADPEAFVPSLTIFDGVIASISVSE